jgi:thiol-disulfide isomerase/thioredoxin
MTRYIAGALLVFAVAACKPETQRADLLKTGIWRAVVEIQNQELPFNFEVVRDDQGGYDIFLINAEERLLLDEITIADDSLDASLHIFDANIKAIMSGDSLTGVFVKNYADGYEVPFRAVHGQEYRFAKSDSTDSEVDFSGTYEVTFVHEKDTTESVALFRQSGKRVTGTFMTPTGDYRFLDGSARGNELELSAFDGNHLYLFRAHMDENGALTGEFFSGKTWYETWVGEKNAEATLPDPESLTYLKDGYEAIEFDFPNVDGKIVRLDDGRFEGKVVILQLLGTWCPNCMDETKFLAPWYDENKDRGVEVIGLAYERKDDFDYASGRVRKMVKKLNVKYDVLIAGTDEKEVAAETLPMLNAIVAFPTTIFIGKDGRVKKIHTGFNGPGTGKYYEQFKEEFNQTVNELLSEDFTVQR